MTKEKLIEEIEKEHRWLDSAGYNAYNMDVAFASLIHKVKLQETKTDVALDRYKDLQDYFSDKDAAKTILEDQKEFKAWLERLRWYVKKAEELARKLEALEKEPCEDAISRSNLLGKLDDCYKEKFNVAPDNMAEGFAQMEKLIKQEPPVTPTRKKGKWINGDPICPCCGEDKFKDLDADIWADWQPKYCPNCGAEMEGEE